MQSLKRAHTALTSLDGDWKAKAHHGGESAVCCVGDKHSVSVSIY